MEEHHIICRDDPDSFFYDGSDSNAKSRERIKNLDWKDDNFGVEINTDSPTINVKNCQIFDDIMGSSRSLRSDKV